MQGTGPSRQFGRYQVIAPLASGGMADIHLASVGGIGGFEKLVVLKCILPNLAKDPRFVKMLLNEARLAALLDHPNIVQVFDVGCIEGQHYIAMEYLSGEALNTVLAACRKRGRLLPVELAAVIVMQAAEGLHHAHTLVGTDGAPLNIIHRDVSPQNIFVLYNGGIKVVDFGIAKARTSDTKTRTGAIRGKVAYMSPEQVLGEDLDARSDVFSLGIVLWECLTCHRLFRRESEYSLMEAIVREQPPSPLTVVPDLPPPLVDITARALQRDRAARYGSAAEMRAALASFLRGWPRAADTMAVGQWMQDFFADRIRRKRALVEEALNRSSDSEDGLFSELGDYSTGDDGSPETPAVESEDAVLRAPTLELRNAVSAEAADRRLTVRDLPLATGSPRRLLPWPLVLAGAAALAALVLALVWLASRAHRPSAAARPDASAVVASPPLDAGLASAAPVADAAATSDSVGAAIDAAVDAVGRDAAAGARSDGVGARPGKSPKATKARAVGTINVACLPWCEIFVDGKPSGRNSPLQEYELEVGPHLIEVVNPPTGARAQKRIVVKKGKSLDLRFRLQ
ncbi:MAG: serine/threonine protein kinase [Deltaproteobacteria bacterium]|nr:serine/threonine protein kinase [Deltaproteobacteria bacterium]